MKIIYPYNEILPLKKAHDAYIIRNCAALADSGADVTLLCGKGSLSKSELFSFYKINPNNPLKIVQLPILRRNNIFHLNWNFVFFHATKRYIQRHHPDIVMFSVLKHADFLLKNKVRGCKYIYEAHQLQWYPSYGAQLNLNKIRWERSIFNRSDLVTATTIALKKILSIYPYDLQTKVEVLPLACDFLPLSAKKPLTPFKLYYIGQLYTKQGLHHLLDALENVEGIELNVVGGRDVQITHYKEYCQNKNIASKVVFKGFVPPDRFQEELDDADAFVTTFDNSERMPYVAHTKIYEYLALQKPIVAPNLEIVNEHAPYGVLTYDTADRESLVEHLTQLLDEQTYKRLASEVKKNPVLNWTERGKTLRAILEENTLIKQEC
ncbi:MAG: hypothetical protein S4CHLAM6_16300 [Chlamydiae bacterium]|nr:hypothetical protein [Chlamydiota bacterium]